MIIDSVNTSVSELQTDLLVLILDDNSDLFAIDDEKLQEYVNGIKQEYADKKRKGELQFTPRHLENIGAAVIYHTNAHQGMNLWESVKICVSQALNLAASTLRKNVTLLLNTPAGAELVPHVTEAAILSSWDCYKYKKEADKFSDLMLSLDVTDVDAAIVAISRASLIANTVNECRMLTTEPADVINPESLAQYAQQMATECGLVCTVLNEEQLLEQGYLGHIKVGSGAFNPPRMIILSYTPEEESDVHLALIGKGLCFDSGGISLKPAANMHEMKSDKAGAAAVISTMRALAKLQPSIKVTAIAVCAENMPGEGAQRPGDIIRFKNGTTVHVENTDAEGRLVLADGLIRAGELGVTHIIDIATLTGGCVRALGESFTGIMGINKRLVDAVTKAGGNTGESYWKLPLPLEYREMLNTPFADLTNSAGPLAAATTAGLFLKEFVPERTPWVHLDIAGTAWHDKKWKYLVPGASGIGVRTLVELICRWSEYMG
ncbi:MAG: leucyl aminopeptidase [bacterium]|nr:leucyl aminopeptidase [bacterium]